MFHLDHFPPTPKDEFLMRITPPCFLSLCLFMFRSSASCLQPWWPQTTFCLEGAFAVTLPMAPGEPQCLWNNWWLIRSSQITHTETDAFRNGAPAKRTTLSRAHFCCKFLPLGVSALMDFAYLFVTYETIKTFYFNSFQNVPISFVLRVRKTVFIISILLNNCDIWRSV